MHNELANFVKQCKICAKELSPRREPLITTDLPLYLWQRVTTDLFIFKGVSYLLVVDYFSRYPVIISLGKNTTSTAIISAIMLIMWMISIAGMFYFTLVNFSPARKSKLLNIYITSIVKTSLLKKYSMKKILEPLVKDLLQLVRFYYNYIQIILAFNKIFYFLEMINCPLGNNKFW